MPSPAGEQLHRLVDLDVRRQHQDAGARKLGADHARGLEPLGLMVRRHADVDDYEVRLVLAHQLEQRGSVACLPDHRRSPTVRAGWRGPRGAARRRRQPRLASASSSAIIGDRTTGGSNGRRPDSASRAREQRARRADRERVRGAAPRARQHSRLRQHWRGTRERSFPRQTGSRRSWSISRPASAGS